MSNIYKKYKKDISKYDLLTKDEELSLIYIAKDGNKKAFDKLVLANQRFVISVAKKFSNQGLDLMDLISLGNLGLIEAINRFDPTTGNKLISYAVWWIKQKIMEGIGNEARLIRLPLNRAAEVQEIIEEFKKHSIGTSYLQTVSKVCDLFKLSEYELVNRVNLYYLSNLKFREKILLDPEDLVAEDFLESRLSLDTKIILQNKLKFLKDRQIYIAANYFDLFGNSKTLESIGEELNLTRERVRQIKVKVIKNLSYNIDMEDFNDVVYIPYSLVNIKENIYSEENSILYELSEYVNMEYDIINIFDVDDNHPDDKNDLNEDILMELYESL